MLYCLSKVLPSSNVPGNPISETVGNERVAKLVSIITRKYYQFHIFYTGKAGRIL